MTLKSKLAAATGLSRTERGLLLRAWFWLLGTDLALRMAPFRLVQSVVTPGCAVGSADGVAGSDIERAALLADPAFPVVWQIWRMVDIAARNHLYPMTCLRRSLVLQRLLMGQGIRTELKIGVRKEAGDLQAHAWVEYKGAAVGEAAVFTGSFVELARSAEKQGFSR